MRNVTLRVKLCGNLVRKRKSRFDSLGAKDPINEFAGVVGFVFWTTAMVIASIFLRLDYFWSILAGRVSRGNWLLRSVIGSNLYPADRMRLVFTGEKKDEAA